ncbi:uncharacterized protein [Miscanthus floridulus]|uniref:uncharacterized protein n=1 Tax=Miscanthus floridulus TaxID=154761 RepID=UPI00345A5DC2
MAPPPRPPPYLMPELIGDILVRFPPDDPACLVRASLVCKPWRRLLCDPAFRRRYVAFHRAPPLLGFLHNCSINDHGKYYTAPRFVCTTTPSPVLPLQPFDDCNYGWRVLDSRHGRVLFKAPNPNRRHGRGHVFFNAPGMNVSTNLAVWDRSTGKHKQLPEPPSPRLNHYTAAVLCAVRGCDHLDCHGGPFLVVFVGCYPLARVVQSHLYSSEASAWSSSSFQGSGFVTVRKPSVLIGDDIYFVLASRPVVTIVILNIDLGKNHLSIINAPEAQHFDGNAVLMSTEDGSLGFAAILGSKLRLWSRNVMNSEVPGGWGRCRVIELQTLIPFKHRLRVVGSAEGSGIIFVASDVGVFSLDLKSSRERKVDEPSEDITIFPFMSFYTPDGSSSKLRLPMGST